MHLHQLKTWKNDVPRDLATFRNWEGVLAGEHLGHSHPYTSTYQTDCVQQVCSPLIWPHTKLLCVVEVPVLGHCLMHICGALAQLSCPCTRVPTHGNRLSPPSNLLCHASRGPLQASTLSWRLAPVFHLCTSQSAQR